MVGFFLFIVLFIIFSKKITRIEEEIAELRRKIYFPEKQSEREQEKQPDIKYRTEKETEEKEILPSAPSEKPPSVEHKKGNVISYTEHGKGLPEKKEESIFNIERIIGERYLVWIGIFVFAIAFATFLKYAFSQGWLNQTVRILIGFLSGFAFTILSQHFYKRKFYAICWGFFSLGLILFYLTVFTAFHFYKIFNAWISFTLFFIITISGMTFAVKKNSFIVGFLSLLGAFATPLFLADPSIQVYYEPKLFSYLLIINLGVAYVSLFKKWRVFSFTAFIFTLIYFGGWFLEGYTPSDFKLTILFSTIYFIVFSFIATFYSLRKKKKSNEEDVLLVVINAIFFFLIFYALFTNYVEKMRNILPLIPLAMGIYHLALASIVRKLNRDDTLLYYAFAGTGLGLLTLPVPLAVKSYWITLAWAYQALILVFFGVRYKRELVKASGLIIYIFVVLRLILRDPLISIGKDYLIFLNLKFLAMFLSCIAFSAQAIVLKKLSSISEEEKSYIPYFWGIWILLIFWIFNIEIITYFLKKAGIVKRTDMSLIFTSIFWSFFAFFLYKAGEKIKSYFLRTAGIVLFVITFLKIFFVDTFLCDFLYGYPFLLNLKFLSAFLFLFLCGWTAVSYAKNVRENRENVFLLWALFICLLFMEVSEQIYSSLIYLGKSQQFALFLLSCFWVFYGFVLLLTGIARKIMLPRVAGLSLFGLTLLKVIFVDLQTIDIIYRIFLLFGVSIIFFISGYFYRKNLST